MLRLYGRYFLLHWRCALVYKSSFFLMIFGQFLTSFTAIFGIYFLFDRFHTVEGFTLPQVLLCSGTVLLSASLAELVGRGFDGFDRMLGNGGFDRVLLRPRSALFQVLAAQMEFSRLGRLLQALLVFAYALPASGVRWTWPKAAALLLMTAGGAVLFFSLLLLHAALCFFTTDALEVLNILTYGGQEFGRYPVVIYGRPLLFFFTFVVPLACVQYYPLLYLLDRAPWPVLLTPLAAVLFLLPCWGMWRLGVKRHRSTGS